MTDEAVSRRAPGAVGLVARAPAPPRAQATPADRARERDPLVAIMNLGSKAVRVGAAIGIGVALLTHSAASARAVTSLYDMQHVLQANRTGLHAFFWALYDVDLGPKEQPKAPEPAPPEPPPPPPPPPPVVKNTPAPKEDPYEPPPAPAKAAEVLTRKALPDEPEDLTHLGFASSDGGVAYGNVAGAGTGDAPTKDPNTSLLGKPGGTGAKVAPVAPPPPPVGPDMSRAARLTGGTSWNCAFPPEADAEQIDQALVTILVTVRADGTPASVQILSNPGHGFDRAARSCALGRRFEPAFDRTGSPIASTLGPLNVRFTR